MSERDRAGAWASATDETGANDIFRRACIWGASVQGAVQAGESYCWGGGEMKRVVINSHESKVITLLDRIFKTPNFFEFSVYERKALGKGKRNEILTHNLYVIKNTVSPEEMTLSYNGTETAPFSEGAWILNTDMDIDSYYNYSRGNNSYDMRLLVSSEYIDTEQTARKIKESIKSDIAYFFLDHKINLKEHENCNTALFGTLVPKKK